MTHLKITQNSNVEIVSNNVIQKLYNTALNTVDASLSGNLQVDHCYRKSVEYLRNRFEDLNINVTGDYFVDFGDDAMSEAVASIFGSSGGVTETQAAMINAIDSSQLNGWEYSINNVSVFGAKVWGNPDIEYINMTPFTGISGANIRSRIINTQLSNIKHINLANFSAVGTTPTASGDPTAHTGSMFESSNLYPNLIDIVYPDVKYINGCACLHRIDARYLYFPKVEYIHRYLLRDTPNLQLIYLGKNLKTIPASFSDHNNSNRYIPLTIVVNAINPPMFTSNDTTTNNSTDSAIWWQNSTQVQATESDINTGSSYQWGFIQVYVPDESLETYKTTTPWTKLASADRIHPISELSSDFKAKILAATGDEL